jgi:HSP90 family molecular chaperone
MNVIKLDTNHLKIKRYFENKKELKIYIHPDEENKCINVADTGIIIART